MRAATDEQQSLPARLSRGLITCIGNKRALLPQLARIIRPLTKPGDLFADPFCGSGGVARLARYLGLRVLASDVEPYAVAVTHPYLAYAESAYEQIFEEWGGADALFHRLNESRPSSSPYISKHYAPASTQAPRLGKERLFYTRENALRIDAIRDGIDLLFPPPVEALPPHRLAARELALSALLVEASIRANTSGVFKAYHRGFGGMGGDALGRIMRPLQLRPPQPGEGPEGRAFLSDAADAVTRRSVDLCYLDPPYSGHQYGSNYFMLNSILRWDRHDVDNSRDQGGDLRAKAGIPGTWKETRSPFCARRGAFGAISHLLSSVDARSIVMSYSTDGIVSIPELAEILSERGDLTAHAIRTPSYRGGRTSPGRSATAGEFAFVVRTSTRSGTMSVPPAVRRVIVLDRLARLAAGRFHPSRLSEAFDSDSRGLVLNRAGTTVWLAGSRDLHRVDLQPPPAAISTEDIEHVVDRLEACLCGNAQDELGVLNDLLQERPCDRSYQRGVVLCLRRIAYRKYEAQFTSWIGRVQALLEAVPDCRSRFGQDVAAVRAIAERRFRAGEKKDPDKESGSESGLVSG